MPLIIICGTPSCGKTLRTNQLKEFFEKRHGKTVQVVSEAQEIINSGFEKNSFYLDSKKEQIVRSALKSEVLRMLNKDSVIILDGSNYIKGFRYELYCGSKASKTTQCTIFPVFNIEESWKMNEKRPDDEKYTREVFDALNMRFEEPNSQNRWDSPLFGVIMEDELPLDDIYKALYERAPPPPNLSTQNAPLTSTNFLYEVDKSTQAICQHILAQQKIAPGSEVVFPGTPANGKLESQAAEAASAPKLMRLRRQYLTFVKANYSTKDVATIGDLFVQYLNKTLSE